MALVANKSDLESIREVGNEVYARLHSLVFFFLFIFSLFEGYIIGQISMIIELFETKRGLQLRLQYVEP